MRLGNLSPILTDGASRRVGGRGGVAVAVSRRDALAADPGGLSAAGHQNGCPHRAEVDDVVVDRPDPVHPSTSNASRLDFARDPIGIT